MRLPAEAVGVAEFETLHYGVDCCSYFGGVRIASVDYAHGERVGGEEEDDVFAGGGVVGGELSFDVLGECFNEAEVDGPAVYDAPGYGAGGVFAF